MGLGGVAIAVLPSMIYPKQPFSDGLGGVFSSFCPLFSVPYFWLSLSGCVMYLSNMNKK